MLSYALVTIFFSLSGMCNAVIDTLSHHYSISIFSRFKDVTWWNPTESWKNKYVNKSPRNGRVKLIWNINMPVQLTDAWHFFKTFDILFTATSIVIAILNTDSFLILKYNEFNYILNFIIYMLVLGTARNLTFSIFYNRILIIKK